MTSEHFEALESLLQVFKHRLDTTPNSAEYIDSVLDVITSMATPITSDTQGDEDYDNDHKNANKNDNDDDDDHPTDTKNNRQPPPTTGIFDPVVKDVIKTYNEITGLMSLTEDERQAQLDNWTQLNQQTEISDSLLNSYRQNDIFGCCLLLKKAIATDDIDLAIELIKRLNTYDLVKTNDNQDTFSIDLQSIEQNVLGEMVIREFSKDVNLFKTLELIQTLKVLVSSNNKVTEKVLNVLESSLNSKIEAAKSKLQDEPSTKKANVICEIYRDEIEKICVCISKLYINEKKENTFNLSKLLDKVGEDVKTLLTFDEDSIKLTDLFTVSLIIHKVQDICTTVVNYRITHVTLSGLRLNLINISLSFVKVASNVFFNEMVDRVGSDINLNTFDPRTDIHNKMYLSEYSNLIDSFQFFDESLYPSMISVLTEGIKLSIHNNRNKPNILPILEIILKGVLPMIDSTDELASKLFIESVSSIDFKSYIN